MNVLTYAIHTRLRLEQEAEARSRLERELDLVSRQKKELEHVMQGVQCTVYRSEGGEAPYLVAKIGTMLSMSLNQA
jgi:hypothetical protein